MELEKQSNDEIIRLSWKLAERQMEKKKLNHEFW